MDCLKYTTYATCIAICLSLALAETAEASMDISTKDRKNILGIHNLYRSPLWLWKLEWSENLEKSADSWASALEKNNCPLVHSPNELRGNIGENLTLGWSSQNDYRLNLREAVTAWAREKRDFSYERNVCASGRICGHYTQMIWRDTKRIGCSLARCELTSGTSEILVCHYDPAGNYIGERPY